MKKIFLTFGVAAMLTMVSCGNKNNENGTVDTAADSTQVIVTEEEVEVAEVSLPDTITSAAQLEEAMKANGWTLNDKGEIVDANGKVVKSYEEAVKAYGDKYKEAVKDYGKKVEEAAKQYGEAVEGAASKAGEKVGKAVEAAGDKADKMIEKANDATGKAMDAANKKAEELMKKTGL